MQITEHTPTILKLEAKSRLIWFAMGIVIALIFFFQGLSFLLDSEVANLRCKRIEATQIDCKIISSDLSGKNITEIKHLEFAKLRTKSSSESGDSYKIMLSADNILIPFTKLYDYDYYSKISQKVNQINMFIANTEKLSLKIQEDNRGIYYPVSCLSMLVGGCTALYFLLYKQIILYVFDKNSGKLYFKLQNLLFQSDVREEKLDAIKQVLVVHEKTDSGGDKFHLKLVLNSGESITLGSLTDNFAFEIKKTIDKFLDINE
ncbi:MAG: hypothetical protein QNJ55_25415 [Xenococcus sp. MO_188.B8]|nr:hypothetical protein [Xenococcus sp. MO_188.B8]